MSNLDKIIATLRREGQISASNIEWVCSRAKEIFMLDSNIISVQSPLIVVGDIHGQFVDMLEMFEKGGGIPDNNFLFLGDLVDRGRNSIGVFCLALSYKIRYPDRVHILRGNHESRQLNQNYGFYDECKRTYNRNVWQMITEVFDFLPLAAMIDDRVFCVHGGISETARTFDQIRVIDRKKEVPIEGPFSDLLWSDPSSSAGSGFEKSDRGAGVLYGPDMVAEFLHKNKAEYIVRSHQLVLNGYEELFDKMVVTVWSAPNYYYRCENLAAILKLDNNLHKNFFVFNKSDRQAEEQAREREVPPEFR